MNDGMLTEVISRRTYKVSEKDDARDVSITRPGPWGNQYPVLTHGASALTKYESWLQDRIAVANQFRGGTAIQKWLAAFRDLAGKRLICACTPQAIRQGRCHGAVMARELEKLTGVQYELAPGNEEED